MPEESVTRAAGHLLMPLCLLAGGLCLFTACINTHGVDENWFIATMLLGCGSVIAAILFVVQVWRCQGENVVGTAARDILLAVMGAGMAAFGMLMTYGVRSMEEADYRNGLVQNRTKMVANALLLYESDKGSLPPAAVYSKDGRPLLSWRVLVLPYLVLDDPSARGLFNEFNLDEPWDSPDNLRLVGRMPKVYASPNGPEAQASSTHFQVFVGKGTAFEGPEGVKLADFPDRGAKTFLVVESAEAVPWTKPEDLRYAVDKPLPKLGSVSRLRFTAAFADGHVEKLSTSLPEEQLRAFITRYGERDE